MDQTIDEIQPCPGAINFVAELLAAGRFFIPKRDQRKVKGAAPNWSGPARRFNCNWRKVIDQEALSLIAHDEQVTRALASAIVGLDGSDFQDVANRLGFFETSPNVPGVAGSMWCGAAVHAVAELLTRSETWTTN